MNVDLPEVETMPRWGGWPPSGFGGRLKQLREAAGLTQQQVAERAGCNPFTVAKLEAGRQEPAWPLVLALARTLGVPCTAFEADAGSSPAPSPWRRPGRPRKATADERGKPATTRKTRRKGT
jgi:transcriptional regulator with XRE-family HTH domain